MSVFQFCDPLVGLTTRFRYPEGEERRLWHLPLLLEAPAGAPVDPEAWTRANVSQWFGAATPADPDGWHKGLDLKVLGARVVSPTTGRVVKAGFDSSGRGGLLVIVDYAHPSGWIYRHTMAHLATIAPGVSAGTLVPQGTTLGISGATGRVTGPHLHWQVEIQYPENQVWRDAANARFVQLARRYPGARAISGMWGYMLAVHDPEGVNLWLTSIEQGGGLSNTQQWVLEVGEKGEVVSRFVADTIESSLQSAARGASSMAASVWRGTASGVDLGLGDLVWPVMGVAAAGLGVWALVRWRNS